MIVTELRRDHSRARAEVRKRLRSTRVNEHPVPTRPGADLLQSRLFSEDDF